MAGIKIIRLKLIATGTDHIEVFPLFNGRLRILNAQDVNRAARVSMGITPYGDRELKGMSLVQRYDQSEAAKDIGWEGDIAVDSSQSAYLYMENTVASDVLWFVIGIEEP